MGREGGGQSLGPLQRLGLKLQWNKKVRRVRVPLILLNIWAPFHWLLMPSPLCKQMVGSELIFSKHALPFPLASPVSPVGTESLLGRRDLRALYWNSSTGIWISLTFPSMTLWLLPEHHRGYEIIFCWSSPFICELPWPLMLLYMDLKLLFQSFYPCIWFLFPRARDLINEDSQGAGHKVMIKMQKFFVY